jgi:hypothetical protein
MVEADRFKTAAICIIVLLFESINEICSRSSGCNLPLYLMAQFSVFSRYTKFCVSTLKSSIKKHHGLAITPFFKVILIPTVITAIISRQKTSTSLTD